MIRQIGLISEHASPLSLLGGVDCGGQNLYVGQVAKALAAMGYEVDVFTRRDSDILPETAEWVNGVRIIHVPAGPPTFVRKEDLLPFMKPFTDYMLQFCRCQRRAYDLFHANFWMSGLVAAELKKALGTPFVITFHALGRVRRQFQRQADEFPDVRFEIEDRLVSEADHIIAEAPQDEEDLIRLYNADPSNITVVPCGFDPSELWPISKTLARISLGLPPEEHVVLHLGRLVPRKGTDTVVRAFGRLSREHGMTARLLIVGGDSDDPDPELTPEIGRLVHIALDEGVADRVTFVGRRGRDQLKYYYSAADVFVTTPWYEPFGITPLEAMACGTPVVGSNVGGIKFTVRDGETGYLVPPNDPDALAEKIAHLYAHPKLLSVLSRQAIQRVNDLFTWSKVTKGLGALYDRVLNEKQLPSTYRADQLAVVDGGFDAAVDHLQETRRRLRLHLPEAAHLLGDAISRGGKILVCGDAERLESAQRLTTDLLRTPVGGSRAGLPAMLLRADTFATDGTVPVDALSKQIDLFARPEDVLIGIALTTLSPTLVNALDAANRRGLHTIAIVGEEPAEVRRLGRMVLTVPSQHQSALDATCHILLRTLSALVHQGLESGHYTSGATASLHSIQETPRQAQTPTTRRRTPRAVTRKELKP
ncbi:MAG: phosphoheptose isomerase [Nitrospira sp. SCN 59-13]|nr:MAG: phosphoheptose isomerase [Nitrospira sp. SCN 59-13]